MSAIKYVISSPVALTAVPRPRHDADEAADLGDDDDDAGEEVGEDVQSRQLDSPCTPRQMAQIPKRKTKSKMKRKARKVDGNTGDRKSEDLVEFR